MREDTGLEEAIQSWLEEEPEKPVEVDASDWLTWEQQKHEQLLASA
jgi:hypothetical protein